MHEAQESRRGVESGRSEGVDLFDAHVRSIFPDSEWKTYGSVYPIRTSICWTFCKASFHRRSNSLATSDVFGVCGQAMLSVQWKGNRSRPKRLPI
jgi:hypothetical protein